MGNHSAIVTTHAPSSSPSDSRTAGEFVLVASLGTAIGYLASLGLKLATRTWVLDANGRPILDDFVAFWAAGRQTLSGHAVSTYDPAMQHAAQAAVIGHGFSGTLDWSYPPLFLFVAALLACLPYAVAFLVWSLTTLAFHASVCAAVAKSRTAFFAACAAPWVLTALTPGQNGFLTAGLFGVVLLQLEERPVIAGLVLALLSYKPQFGILFPLALAAGGYWRAFAWAALGALAWNGLAIAIFGAGTLEAFFHALVGTTHSHLTSNGIGWNKLQSLYALMRALGASGAVAWAAQGLLSLSAAAVVVVTWRGSISFALKAAILIAAIPLTTPYILAYDLPMLAVATAFLFRDRRFDNVELVLLAASVPASFAILWATVPSAFFASLAIAAIALRRLVLAEPSLARSASRPVALPSRPEPLSIP